MQKICLQQDQLHSKMRPLATPAWSSAPRRCLKPPTEVLSGLCSANRTDQRCSESRIQESFTFRSRSPHSEFSCRRTARLCDVTGVYRSFAKYCSDRRSDSLSGG